MDLRTQVLWNISKSNTFLGLQLDFFPLELDFFLLELDLEKVLVYHADTCKPNSRCLFCGVTGLQEEEMKSHLARRHGVVFQQEWKRHCSQHCR